MSEHMRLETLAASAHDLAPPERSELDAHLAVCSSCRVLAQEYARQDVFLRALPLPVPDASMRRDVFSRLRQRPARRLSALRGRLLFAGPALIMVLAIVLITARTAPVGTRTTLRALPDPIFGPASRASASGHDGAAQQSAAVNNLPQGPAASSPLRVDTFGGGIRLTLIVPRRGPYRGNAVVPVEIDVQNRTGGLIFVHSSGSSGGDGIGPTVEAIDARGEAVNPHPDGPVFNSGPAMPGRYGYGLLRPGQTLRTKATVALLTNRIRARANITRYRGCNPLTQSSCSSVDTAIVGRPLVLHLQPARPHR